MIFRKAEISDEKKIEALYTSVKGGKYSEWNEEYPGLPEIVRDTACAALYVLEEDGEIIGSASIVPENEYDSFSCWSVREKAREFARVAVAPAWQGKGLSKLIVKNILDILEKEGCGAAHILVAKRNIPAQRTYASLGFKTVGECREYEIDFYIMEKML